MFDIWTWILADNFDRLFFSFITLIIVGAALLDIKNKNYPPGPSGLPLVGYLPFLNNSTPYKTLSNLTQQYGRVFGVQLGNIYGVVIADMKLIQQAFSQAENITLPPLYLTQQLKKEKGLRASDDEDLKTHRSFAASVLNDGKVLAKSHIENEIQKNIREFIKELNANGGSEQDISGPLSDSVGQLLMKVIMGSTIEKNHPNWSTLKEMLEIKSNLTSLTQPLNYVPLLKKITGYSENVKTLVDARDKSDKIFAEIIEKQSAQISTDIKCVLDAYLNETKKNGSVGSFTESKIQQVLTDLVSFGWEGTLATLKWLYLYMALYPEIQERIRSEIKILGKSGDVTVDDLDKLPYMEATVLEIWRHRSILPFGVPHATKQKTKIGDFEVPKNSMIIPLLWAVHHDSKVWEKPEIFSPERFLYEDGSVSKNTNLFQSGSRMCIGEEMSQWIVKLFLANTLSRFEIDFPKGYKYNVADTPLNGTTLVPRPYQLLFK